MAQSGERQHTTQKVSGSNPAVVISDFVIYRYSVNMSLLNMYILANLGYSIQIVVKQSIGSSNNLFFQI